MTLVQGRVLGLPHTMTPHVAMKSENESGGSCQLRTSRLASTPLTRRRHLSPASFRPRRGPLRHLPLEDRLPYMIPGLCNSGEGHGASLCRLEAEVDAS